MSIELLVTIGLNLEKFTQRSGGVGLLILVIQDANRSWRTITYQELHTAVHTHLPQHLERLRVPQPETATQALLTYLQNNQSLFTLSVR